MKRKARFSFVLPDQTRIGYSLKWRGGVVRIQFPDPTRQGHFVEKTTGCRSESDAHVEGAKIVLKSYAHTIPVDPESRTWSEATADLEKTTLRPKTLATYLDAIKLFCRLQPTSKSPADVTVDVAQRFARVYALEPFRRSRSSTARTYTRSAQTVYNTIAALSIAWNHFLDRGYAKENPWERVKRPKLPKRLPALPAEAAFTVLDKWLDSRFPGWTLPKVFVAVKMVSGCRLNDLCQVRSDQLRDGVLTIRPDQDKTHRERQIPLPESLVVALDAIKGPTYLWERYAAEARVYRKGRRNSGTFRPSLMYNFSKWLFKEYAKAHPEAKVKSHDFRKRAITMTAAATQNVDQTASALGVTSQTAARYYLDSKRAFDGQELMRKMASVLLPTPSTTAPKPPQNPGKSEGNGVKGGKKGRVKKPG